MNDKLKSTIEMVTLKQLCVELKVDPREGRERPRLAVRDTKKKILSWRNHISRVTRGSGRRTHLL